jgi:small subunit ribosomal protein S3
VVIGRKGANVNILRTQLEALTSKKAWVEVQEVEKPELNAVLIAESIAEQLGKRVSHKRAMKQAVMRAVRSGAKGIKIRCAGRLAGADMARREWVKDGRIPLQTLRADIDYACSEAATVMGRIGIKVWVYHGELLPEAIEPREAPAPMAEEA